MTKKQLELQLLIKHQRRVLEKLPGDHVEEVTFDTLITKLRQTFRVIDCEVSTQYIPSPSRAVLKRVV